MTAFGSHSEMQETKLKISNNLVKCACHKTSEDLFELSSLPIEIHEVFFTRFGIRAENSISYFRYDRLKLLKESIFAKAREVIDLQVFEKCLDSDKITGITTRTNDSTNFMKLMKKLTTSRAIVIHLCPLYLRMILPVDILQEFITTNLHFSIMVIICMQRSQLSHRIRFI